LTKLIKSANKFCDNKENSNLALACMCMHSKFACLRGSCSHQNPNLFEIRRNWLGRCSCTEYHVYRTRIGIDKMLCQLKYFLFVMSIQSYAVASCHDLCKQTTTNQEIAGTNIFISSPCCYLLLVH
jgi:hypothetical protein